jgi:hypothetical protein
MSALSTSFTIASTSDCCTIAAGAIFFTAPSYRMPRQTRKSLVTEVKAPAPKEFFRSL